LSLPRLLSAAGLGETGQRFGQRRSSRQVGDQSVEDRAKLECRPADSVRRRRGNCVNAVFLAADTRSAA